ncbi:hypothetical protein [Brevundimonas sp. GCM10030266]|uniref:hypothetical protein n=1 Tax=Brevundimonas sp. GCM10030266 TaxID=3273386 RepID=UPI00360FE259
MISLLAAASLLTAQPACAPVSGSDALWGEELRFIAVGELHGTAEAPAAFADLVCLALKKGPVTAVLEYPVQMQATFDAFMAEPDADAARALLLDYPHGPFRYHDGRGSEAMLAMLQRFRALHQAGGDLKLLASVPASPRVEGFTQSHAELDRAQLWSAAARAAPERRMMIFVGSVHAGKARRFGSSLGLPAAAHFRPEEVLSLYVATNGGEAWNCREECGPYALTPLDLGDRRGVVIAPEADGAFDGYLAVGPATASPPVARP